MTLRVAIDWRRDVPELRGARAELREPTAADADAISAVLSVGDATRFGLDESAGAAATLVAQAQRQREAGVALTCAVVDRACGHAVGLVQVKRLDPAFEGAEWECTLLPAARGTGIFSDVAALVQTFAFEVAGAHRLEARALSTDGRANAALRKIGAVPEGVLRRALRRRGAYVDQVLWSILKDDWAAASPQQHPARGE